MRRVLYLALCIPALAFASEELRYEGFTDREIHEMELALQEFTNGEILYISGARKGCKCEEGTSCTHQVQVVTRKNSEISTWPLSHIEGKWQIGKLFRWQRQYDALLKEFDELRDKPLAIRREFAKANAARARALKAAKPQCEDVSPTGSLKISAPQTRP